MRLLQLNAWSLRIEPKIVDMVRAVSPDIINLQEVVDSETGIGLLPRLRDFAHTIQFRHSYLSPVLSIAYMAGKLDFGNAILSNLTLQEKYSQFTNLEYASNFTYDDDYNIRNFQHVVAEDQDGKKFHVINHHGYHVPGHKKGNDFTLRACRQIAEYAATLQGPIIITGDFNLEPESESLQVLNESFRNLSTEYDLQTTRNSLTSKQEVCDYIFVNDQVEVQHFYASDIMASDHQGLVMDFEIKSTI